MNRPLAVSVVVPTYNGARYLAATLESALGQSLDELEVVVTDDASTDQTLEVIERFRPDPRVRVLASAGRVGAAANWNRGLQAARGRWVKVLCQDDVLHPACLTHQLGALEATPGAVLATGSRRVIGPTGRVLLGRIGGLSSGRHDGDSVLGACLRRGTNVVGEPSTVLFDARLARRIGGFRAAGYVTDLEMWLRLLDHGALVALDESLVDFRVHQGAWTFQLRSEQARQVRELLAGRVGNGATRAGQRRLAARSGTRQLARGLLYAVAAREAV